MSVTPCVEKGREDFGALSERSYLTRRSEKRVNPLMSEVTDEGDLNLATSLA